MIPQIPTIAVVHDQKQSLFSLKSIDHIDQKRMPQLLKQSLLVHYTIDRFFRDDFHF